VFRVNRNGLIVRQLTCESNVNRNRRIFMEDTANAKGRVPQEERKNYALT
jgi:hypothetical protein